MDCRNNGESKIMFRTIYSDGILPLGSLANNSLFLAGPTPRSQDVASWRPRALEILEELNFEGTVFIPEPENGKFSVEYDDQIGWETEALKLASVIVFWVPRSLPDMPAFTTNIEWGMWYNSGKVVFGAPPDAPKNKYMIYHCRKYNIPNFTTLEDTLAYAAEWAAVK